MARKSETGETSSICMLISLLLLKEPQNEKNA